ncbi:hypothetical protein [Streptomyces sp. NBC_00878]|uniref:hypothetical protein n=1 Tax=Streptomyces sp. NBC_00878 TaxID=2975854 RepID=UPI00224ED9A7|nr:hypothetical protein [Streptomyces sp. NBC_00878]MCX4902767.1 hypothetical protein [Streptomyces sp. NBC_00878]
MWPFRLHGLVRSTIRTADDHTDDRWSPADWQQAAQRAFHALGEQWSSGPDRDRILWSELSARAWLWPATSASNSTGSPARPGTTSATPCGNPSPRPPRRRRPPRWRPPRTPWWKPSALARRQHEHRARTVERLASVIDAGQLPIELNEMAVYYRAKAQRDLGLSSESRQGMQYVADRDGRLAPAARRGLAHLARLAGDLPAALATADTLGWAGRHHRVRGDIWWPHGDMQRAAADYAAARAEAEDNGIAGERATSQAQRAFVLAFTSPGHAADEIDLAHQLLTGLVLRVTTATVQLAELIRDAGTSQDIEDRAERLRTEIRTLPAPPSPSPSPNPSSNSPWPFTTPSSTTARA